MIFIYYCKRKQVIVDQFKSKSFLILKKASFHLEFKNDNGFRMAGKKKEVIFKAPQVATGKCLCVCVHVCTCMQVWGVGVRSSEFIQSKAAAGQSRECEHYSPGT